MTFRPWSRVKLIFDSYRGHMHRGTQENIPSTRLVLLCEERRTREMEGERELNTFSVDRNLPHKLL